MAIEERLAVGSVPSEITECLPAGECFASRGADDIAAEKRRITCAAAVSVTAKSGRRALSIRS
ncbi:hypothetical protein [Paraburkholderia sp. CNPSo 3076]|uniref:hypothetical protein n=1 Tax=Paraburkholderia sp. CNPSo 3076 TaxID=2940936 RepID=UPI003A520FA1